MRSKRVSPRRRLRYTGGTVSAWTRGLPDPGRQHGETAPIATPSLVDAGEFARAVADVAKRGGVRITTSPERVRDEPKQPVVIGN